MTLETPMSFLFFIHVSKSLLDFLPPVLFSIVWNDVVSHEISTIATCFAIVHDIPVLWICSSSLKPSSSWRGTSKLWSTCHGKTSAGKGRAESSVSRAMSSASQKVPGIFGPHVATGCHPHVGICRIWQGSHWDFVFFVLRIWGIYCIHHVYTYKIIRIRTNFENGNAMINMLMPIELQLVKKYVCVSTNPSNHEKRRTQSLFYKWKSIFI